MSAIVGIYYRDQRPAELGNLQRMVDILAHRGPDGSDVWCDESIGLGHRMLWTTPESLLEKLPLTKGNLAITADARIDNRDELISVLQLNHCPPDKITDSEIILAAYQEWGETCPEKLLGDFAFAIWDGRTQTLFCARDPMGVKPFYYYSSAGIFAFSSEIKALLCLDEVPCQLNEVRVADYLTGLFEDRAMTFYKEISSLPAATGLIVRPDKLQSHIYWSFDPSREIQLGSDQEYAEAFLDVFKKSVDCRLRSAFPIGSTLSGGLDSSSIACTARNFLTESGRNPLHTFSAIFPSLPKGDLKRIDERSYIDAVVKMGNIHSHYVRADLTSPLPNLEKLLWYQEQPFPPPNLYMHLAIYKAAQAHNVRIMFDGTDGDTTVSHGFDLFPELIRTGRWQTLLSEIGAFSDRYSLPYWKTLIKYGLKPLAPDLFNQAEIIFRKKKSFNDIERFPMINPNFYQKIGLNTRISAAFKKKKIHDTARVKHAFGLASPVFQLVLEINDKATAAHGLEPRYPFFDRRLMEFCIALPANQKLRQGWSRAVLRHAMEGILPPKVQWRLGKGNLSSNYRRKLLEYEKKTIEGVLFKESELVKEYINVAALQSEFNRHKDDPMSSDAMAICAATTLGIWLKNIHSRYS